MLTLGLNCRDDDDYDTPHSAATPFGSSADPVLPAGIQAAVCPCLLFDRRVRPRR